MTTPPFERLVERHGHELFVYLFRMLREAPEAEDCLQETFLRAFRAHGRLDGNANHRAWLYRIATNVALTHLKRRGREAARSVELQPELHDSADGRDPSESAERNELLASVAAAVEGLPPKQRAALVLHHYQRLSYAEIASTLGCSTDAARANVHQALKKLREKLKPAEPTEEAST